MGKNTGTGRGRRKDIRLRLRGDLDKMYRIMWEVERERLTGLEGNRKRLTFNAFMNNVLDDWVKGGGGGIVMKKRYDECIEQERRAFRESRGKGFVDDGSFD